MPVRRRRAAQHRRIERHGQVRRDQALTSAAFTGTWTMASCPPPVAGRPTDAVSLSKVNARSSVPLCASVFVTVTSTTAGKCAGVMQVIWLLASPRCLAGRPAEGDRRARLEVGAGDRDLVPPRGGPRFGLMAVTTGLSSTATW